MAIPHRRDRSRIHGRQNLGHLPNVQRVSLASGRGADDATEATTYAAHRQVGRWVSHTVLTVPMGDRTAGQIDAAVGEARFGAFGEVGGHCLG